MASQTETLQINMELVGFVTLSNQEREKPPSRVISSDRNGRTPRTHRGGAEALVRSGRGEMALDVENVVDGGVR